MTDKMKELLYQYRSDLRHPVTDPGSLERRLEAIEAALSDGPPTACTTCQKCGGFMKKGVNGSPEWLSECADERMTLPHDGLISVPSGGCDFYAQAVN